jgi:hypothetical protein
MGMMMFESASDPTILALRRVLDAYSVDANSREHLSGGLVREIFRCLPADVFNPVFLPADGASGPHLAITFKPAFRRYVAFAAEYWKGLVIDHGQSSALEARANLPEPDKYHI